MNKNIEENEIYMHAVYGTKLTSYFWPNFTVNGFHTHIDDSTDSC